MLSSKGIRIETAGLQLRFRGGGFCLAVRVGMVLVVRAERNEGTTSEFVLGLMPTQPQQACEGFRSCNGTGSFREHLYLGYET